MGAMRLIRYQKPGQPINQGWIHNELVGPVEGDLSGEFRRMEANIPISQVRLMAPISPTKIICVGRNYVAHAKEHQADVPDSPLLFLKPPSSIIGPDETILLPPQSDHVEHEAELAVIIGKQGRWIPVQNALQHVLGYTIANDVTARDLQRKDNQWTRGKGFDTFCPLGPWIETEFDPSDAMISCHVNGDLRQMGSTRDMVFSVKQLIAFASTVMTLEPGDVILTGTPAGVSPLSPDDVVEVSIDGLGMLRNPVASDGRR
jgi:2-keto-4-pentenoate hydratase/2-oxohepta-3-ene-1,7-dioic acid hydratase in catechol pathway